MYKFILAFFIIIFHNAAVLHAANNAIKVDLSGIKFSGVDTIGSHQYGFPMDFYLQRPCTSANESGCYRHVSFKYSPAAAAYLLINLDGRFSDIGKMKFDSITSAPPDSGMSYDLGYGGGYGFAIAPDSLPKCIGNVYIIKTGRDPRWGVPFYAKIKILSFTVRDSAKHEVDMGFLWACNISGSRDLVTTGLDTFNLETPTILSYDKGSTRLRPAVSARPGKYSTFLMLHGRQVLRGVGVPGVSVGGVGLDGRSGRELAN